MSFFDIDTNRRGNAAHIYCATIERMDDAGQLSFPCVQDGCTSHQRCDGAVLQFTPGDNPTPSLNETVAEILNKNMSTKDRI